MTPQLKSYTTNAAITIMQHLESYTVVAEQILFFLKWPVDFAFAPNSYHLIQQIRAKLF